MTATARRSTALSEHAARAPELKIGAMTIRGRGLSPAAGQSLAAAVADVLTRQLAGRSRRIGGMTIRMPASALDPTRGIDRAALAQAIARARRDADA